jgi:hypothetical protein
MDSFSSNYDRTVTPCLVKGRVGQVTVDFHKDLIKPSCISYCIEIVIAFEHHV